MLGYMKEANPHFDYTNSSVQEAINNDFFYTDTDSLQMSSKNAKLIKNLGVKSLGGITDDLGNCKIIRGIWIAPKLYCLVYIKPDSNKLYYHLRGKGLNKSSLNIEAFEAMNNNKPLTNTRDFAMKKIHIDRNSKQQTIPAFSIVHYSKDKTKNIKILTRTVNTTSWAGRRFLPGDCRYTAGSVPWQ